MTRDERDAYLDFGVVEIGQLLDIAPDQVLELSAAELLRAFPAAVADELDVKVNGSWAEEIEVLWLVGRIEGAS